MPFDPSGNFDPVAGATDAAPGQVILSATWNSINVDYDEGLTTLMQQAVFIEYIIDGGGLPIVPGQKGYIQIPFECTIIGWNMYADQSTTTVVDVWGVPYANFPPSAPNSITGSAMPTLTAQQGIASTTLTGWTLLIPSQEILAFDVVSNNNATRVTLVLVTQRNTAS